MPSKNIVLIGMPGSGKSTVGRRLAKTLNMSFVDTDHLIERAVNMPIQALVNRRGLSYFSLIEEQILTSLTPTNCVIATGGSAVYSHSGMQTMADLGSRVYLHINLPTLVRRVHNTDSRGLVKLPSHSLVRLYRERLPLYSRVADVVFDNSRPITALSIDKLIKEIAAFEND